MVALADRIADLYEVPEAADPNDADAIADGTTATAGKTKKRRRDTAASAGGNLSVSEMLDGSEKGRLRMKPAVPMLANYTGQRVSRKDVFDGNDGVDEPASDGESGDDAGLGDLGMGFSISEDVDKAYERIVRESKQELEVMRTPSKGELAKKEAEAALLRQRLSAWNSLVEMRIHLETSLCTGHRMPVGAQKELGQEVASTTDQLGDMLAGLLDMQGALASEKLQLQPLQPGSQEDTWSSLESRVQPVLDWALGVADRCKEQTRLETRRGFKVLDQSLVTQMQAHEQVEPEKLRARCTPPPQKYKVFGMPVNDEAKQEATVGESAECKEIFDDRDFYVQLLREVLAAGSSGSAAIASNASADLQAELQGRRAAKKARKVEVERHSSKGRKVRYVAIEKLQNFMAPVPRADTMSADVGSLDDEAVEAMMRSMFR